MDPDRTSAGDFLRLATVTVFGFGLSRIAPGTIGTLPAVAVYVLIAIVFPGTWKAPLIGVVFLLSCVLSVALGKWAEKKWDQKDPRPFVIDEFAGFFMTVLLFQAQDLFLTVLWAFGMTRFFDIVKPPPARQVERLSAGWGMLLDDLAASMYAALLLNLILQSAPSILLFPYTVIRIFLPYWT